jgi:D-proline reductase (dithiol) PrdB
MPRLDRLSELARKTLLTHNVMVHDDSPWTPLSKPLSECRVALVTTGGLHLRADKPFTNGDQTFRVIPSGTPPKDILLSHTSIGFDRSGVIRDLNLVFPMDRLRELVEQGEIGSVGPNHYSFLGAQRKYDGLIGESGPEVGRRLKAEGVDAILMTGA